GSALFASGMLLLTLPRASLLSAFYEIPLRPNDEDRGVYDRTEASWQEKICHGASAGAAAYVQSYVHRLWPDPGILYVAQGHNESGGLPARGEGVQRAHGLHMWWRTAYLSPHRSAREGAAQAIADRLHLHKRHVHAQEDAGMAGDGIAERRFW